MSLDTRIVVVIPNGITSEELKEKMDNSSLSLIIPSYKYFTDGGSRLSVYIERDEEIIEFANCLNSFFKLIYGDEHKILINLQTINEVPLLIK